MPDWGFELLQAIFGHLLYDLLLAAGVAGLIAYLKSKQSIWVNPAVYGLSAFAAVLVISYVFVGHALLSKEQPLTTAENVENNIRVWADAFQLGVTKMPSQAEMDFGLVVTMKSGTPVEIRKMKNASAYLQIQCNLALSPDHQKVLAKLTEDQSAFVTEELSVELARSRMGFTIIGPPVQAPIQAQPQIQLVVLSKSAPISGLTESTFLGYVNEMDSAATLSRSTTALLLDHGPLHDSVTRPLPTAVH